MNWHRIEKHRAIDVISFTVGALIVIVWSTVVGWHVSKPEPMPEQPKPMKCYRSDVEYGRPGYNEGRWVCER